MNQNSFGSDVFRTLVGLSMAAVTMSASAGAKSVDCDRETDDQDVIQKAIDAGRPGDAIALSGTCDGLAIEITVPGIELQGPAQLTGTGAAPVVRIQDADAVSIRDVDVSGGTVGVEVANSRVTATNVDASNNAVDGFSVIHSAALECVDCSASSNGSRGLLATGDAVLCGSTVFDGNAVSGALVFLGGRLFASPETCGSQPAISMSGNDNGLTLFQGAAAYIDQATLTISAVGSAVNVLDSSLTVRRSTVALDSSGVVGLVVIDGGTARINDDQASISVGSTSIQSNGILGVSVVYNSQVTLGNATVTGNAGPDLLVREFSVANSAGTSTVGIINCQLGRSGGNLCPP